MANNRKAFKLTELFQVPHSPKLSVPSSSIAMPDNFVGIELELEGSRLPTRMTGWQVKQDGSLRQGLEYVTNGPVVGSGIIDALDKFNETLVANRTEVLPSARTSTHVHLDFSQERDTINLIQDWLAAYYLIEDCFFGFTDIDRKYVGYCAPWRDHKISLFDILKARSLQEAYGALENCGRYVGANVASLKKYGTIELRHSALIYRTEEVVRWINLGLRLKKFVYDNCSIDKSIVDVLQETGLPAFVKTVLAGEERLYQFVDYPEMEVRLRELTTVLPSNGSDVTPRTMVSWSASLLNLNKNPVMGARPAALKKSALKRAEMAEQVAAQAREEIVPEVRLEWDRAIEAAVDYFQPEDAPVNAAPPRQDVAAGRQAQWNAGNPFREPPIARNRPVVQRRGAVGPGGMMYYVDEAVGVRRMQNIVQELNRNIVRDQGPQEPEE